MIKMNYIMTSADSSCFSICICKLSLTRWLEISYSSSLLSAIIRNNICSLNWLRNGKIEAITRKAELKVIYA